MSNVKKFRIKSFKDKSVILKLEKISLKFGRKTILDNLNLQLNNGQILGLLGPNGVGKTTIFNIITGLISPDFGSVIIRQGPPPPWRLPLQPLGYARRCRKDRQRSG